MKKFYSLLFLLTCVSQAQAQCSSGYNTAVLNWDYLDYLTRNGTYTSFVTPTMVNSQKFAFGVNRLSIDLSGALTILGENTTNTAEAGSYGSGADLEFGNVGVVTVNLDAPVFNFQFSVYDVDLAQILRVNAYDAAGLPLNVEITPVLPGVVTVVANNTTNAWASASNTILPNDDRRGSVNVRIAGGSPIGTGGIKKVVIDMNRTGNWWLSDFSACVNGAFPQNYYQMMEPWVGQPGYYLVTPDNNSVYLFNPLTGKADWLFSEPSSPWINSLAHDPVNRIVYYTMDHSSPQTTNRQLKKWDANTETISTVIPDLTAFGIPLYEIVVESAGAAFYNGSLYLGVEGTNTAKNSLRESIIWRIDFDAALNPVKACQVFAMPADNGSGLLTHDWGDFTIKDGTLFDFNTGNGGATAQFLHFNMQSGGSVIYNTNGAPAPIQAGQTWDGKLWWTGGQGAEGGRVARYNENGTIGAKVIATASVCSPPWVGRAGDASDPFRPKSDFGDAPVSYDPNPKDKATHEYDCNLRLGNTFDREWDKTSSLSASADGTDEDGISTVSVLPSGSAVYYIQDVKVLNTTGANATLMGWLDHNSNGLFDAGEARKIIIPSSPAIQTVTLSWAGIPVTSPGGTYTFLRIRVTSESNNMDIANATGWFENGEVEDYRVQIESVLPVTLLNFKAAKQDKHHKLSWVVSEEKEVSFYAVERSSNGLTWEELGRVHASEDTLPVKSYSFNDTLPLRGINQYRLRIVETHGNKNYSNIAILDHAGSRIWVTVAPNPVRGDSRLLMDLDKASLVTLTLSDMQGKILFRGTHSGTAGLNQYRLSNVPSLPKGVYMMRVEIDGRMEVVKLVY